MPPLHSSLITHYSSLGGMVEERENSAEYDLLMELEQLETLKEEMEELRVSTIEEIEARMRELNRQIDELQRKS
jgi:hypothetical protein